MRDHFEYCAGLVGIEHLAFGPDTLYGDHVALHRIFAHLLSLGSASPEWASPEWASPEWASPDWASPNWASPNWG
jgi:hypothetical protein